MPALNQRQIDAHLKNLDHPNFTTRQTAAAALRKLGEPVRGPLERFLTGEISTEARKQAETLLDQLAQPSRDAAFRRELRLIEVLERVATPEAKALLDDLSRGADGAALTREAAAARNRIR